MNRRVFLGLGLVGVLFVGVFAWNYLLVGRHVSDVIAKDARNHGVGVSAHFHNYVDPSVLVFDLREVPSDKAPIDIFRVLMQFASAVKDRQFSKVVLAHRGKPKFLLSGAYFQQLGMEYGQQNPVFTARTFPENLFTIDGKEAFAKWTGGVLGVLKEQMEDFTTFHQRWYIEDLAVSPTDG